MIHPDTKTKRGDPICHSLRTEEMLPYFAFPLQNPIASLIKVIILHVQQEDKQCHALFHFKV